MAGNLTPHQERFVTEYLIDLNGQEAYRRAGYRVTTDASARAAASRLLTNVSVKNAIQQAIEERCIRVGMRADEVLQELRVLGRSSVQDYVVDDNGRVQVAEGVLPEAIRAVSSIKRRVRRFGEDGEEIETEIRLWDKNTALANAGRHLGLFTEKVNIKHSNDPDNPLPDGVNTYDVDDLGLPLDVRTQVLEAMKLKQARLRQGNAGDE